MKGSISQKSQNAIQKKKKGEESRQKKAEGRRKAEGKMAEERKKKKEERKNGKPWVFLGGEQQRNVLELSRELDFIEHLLELWEVSTCQGPPAKSQKGKRRTKVERK